MAFAIRLAAEDDAPRIAEIYRPIVESTPISFETDPPTASDMRRRVEETLRFYPWIVCEHEGGVVGYAYAAAHRVRAAYRWSVDTSVYVDAAFHRRRVGRALYTSLLGILVTQGHFNAYAGITLPNPASVALHESVGFRPLGVYRNVGYKLWRVARCRLVGGGTAGASAVAVAAGRHRRAAAGALLAVVGGSRRVAGARAR